MLPLTAEACRHETVTDAARRQGTCPADWGFDWLLSCRAGGVNREPVDPEAPDADERAHTTELRSGVGNARREAQSCRFLFNTTWDPERFTSRQWDGGKR